jgi:hypothetical protein
MIGAAPLDDVVDWARGNGREIVLCVLGAVLLVRFVAWTRYPITDRVDAFAAATGSSVFSCPATTRARSRSSAGQ